MGSLRFKKESSKDFYSVLQNKVTEYFDLHQISKKADLTTIFKSINLVIPFTVTVNPKYETIIGYIVYLQQFLLFPNKNFEGPHCHIY